MEKFKNYGIIAGAVFLGALLRLMFLDFKPLWLDEVITALFSLGHTYQDIPVERVFLIRQIEEIFTLNYQANCPQIAYNLIWESTHPPLFFCLLHQWLAWVGKSVTPASFLWLWILRFLPALFGVLLIPTIYLLARIAFCRQVALGAALITAVSPFGVYLSQEARHYTLPVLLITISLIFLVIIQKNLASGKQINLGILLLWVLTNTLSFYVHYFCLISFFSQIICLFILARKDIKVTKITHKILIIATFIPLIFYLPWLSILLLHFQSTSHAWMPPPENISPIYQIFISWVLMIIALPVERQHWWVMIPCGLVMLLYSAWLVTIIFFPLKALWQNAQKKNFLKTFVYFISAVLLIFLGIVYLLRKDITVAPRYAFVYYPALCVILAAGLFSPQIRRQKSWPKIALIVLIIGIISSFLVTTDLAFKKPFDPRKLATDILKIEPQTPRLIAMAYKDKQDIALGLSFALEINRQWRAKMPEIFFIFLQRQPSKTTNSSNAYEIFWQSFVEIESLPAFPLNLWVIAPELEAKNYPSTINLLPNQPSATCLIDQANYYSVEVPYQLYRCRD